MISDVQLCQFEHEGVPMSLVLRALPNDLMALELRDHFPPLRSISFSPEMLEQMISGDLECIESPDRQCALVRNGDRVEISFSAPEVGEQADCDVSVEELRNAIGQITGNSAYIA
jgi:hypothetical protein